MAVSTTLVKVIKPVREGFEAKRKKATFSERDTDMKAKLAEARAVIGTMREQLAGRSVE